MGLQGALRFSHFCSDLPTSSHFCAPFEKRAGEQEWENVRTVEEDGTQGTNVTDGNDERELWERWRRSAEMPLRGGHREKTMRCGFPRLSNPYAYSMGGSAASCRH